MRPQSNKITPSTLGDRVRSLRADAGFTQPSLAKALGISVSYLNLLEAGGRNNPTIETIDRISTFFGVTKDWLLDGKEPMILVEDAQAARERYYELVDAKLGGANQREIREQKLMAEISVMLAQLPWCSDALWGRYRDEIMAAIDDHAAYCRKHAPEIRLAGLKAARAAAHGSRK